MSDLWPLIPLTLPHIYILVGAFFAAMSLLSILDASNPRRLANFLFWGLLATSFLAGNRLGDLGNGRSLDSETLAARLRAVLVKDVARGGPP